MVLCQIRKHLRCQLFIWRLKDNEIKWFTQILISPTRHRNTGSVERTDKPRKFGHFAITDYKHLFCIQFTYELIPVPILPLHFFLSPCFFLGLIYFSKYIFFLFPRILIFL